VRYKKSRLSSAVQVKRPANFLPTSQKTCGNLSVDCAVLTDWFCGSRHKTHYYHRGQIWASLAGFFTRLSPFSQDKSVGYDRSSSHVSDWSCLTANRSIPPSPLHQGGAGQTGVCLCDRSSHARLILSFGEIKFLPPPSFFILPSAILFSHRRIDFYPSYNPTDNKIQANNRHSIDLPCVAGMQYPLVEIKTFNK